MADDHVELKGSNRKPPQDSVRRRDVDPGARIDVTITLKGPELPSPAKMPKRPLSRREVDRKFGVRPAVIRKVERVLQSFKLRIDRVMQGGRSLRVSGTAKAMAAAFQPKLGVYELRGEGELRGRVGPLMVPRALAGLITGIEGLDQRPMAFRHAAHRATPRRKDKARKKSRVSGEADAGEVLGLGSGRDGRLTPADVVARYNFPPGKGAGQTIVIAEFGAPVNNHKLLPPAYIKSDLAAFCALSRLPKPKVKITPLGIKPLNEQQYKKNARRLSQELRDILYLETAETMMDVELVAGLCPKADIHVYFASWTQKGWIDFLDEVTSLETTKPVTVSISYGLAEESPDWSGCAMTSVGHRLQIAAMMGINICVSAGDDGTGCNQRGRSCHVEFPASSPFVLSVGGTMLKANRSGPLDEVVWWEKPGRRTNNGGGATGGGVSVCNRPAPPWQTVRIPSRNAGAPRGRVVPDVAALAGPPFFDNVIAGERTPGAGTSASTPVWASLIARISAALRPGKRRRFIVPLLYSRAVAKTGFRDIVSGANGPSPRPDRGYEARRGFDAVSGLGVPDGQKLLAALRRV
jgi:kumamolisin